MFSDDFRSLMNPSMLEDNDDQEPESLGGWLLKREPLNLGSQNGNPKEEDVMEQDMMEEDKSKCGISIGAREIDRDFVEIETSDSDSSPTMVKNSDFPKTNKLEGGNTASGENMRWRKRRSVMNDAQVRIMERALLNEPDMQRNMSSMQSWADELSRHGSEVTWPQLRNWLNNRKVKLSHASKEALAILEAENAIKGETLNSPTEAIPVKDSQVVQRPESNETSRAMAEPVQWKEDYLVKLLDERGVEIGTGRVQQVRGKWCGMSLDESGKCVVDIARLKVDRWRKVLWPSEAAGATFEEAEKRFWSYESDLGF